MMNKFLIAGQTLHGNWVIEAYSKAKWRSIRGSYYQKQVEELQYWYQIDEDSWGKIKRKIQRIPGGKYFSLVNGDKRIVMVNVAIVLTYNKNYKLTQLRHFNIRRLVEQGWRVSHSHNFLPFRERNGKKRPTRKLLGELKLIEKYCSDKEYLWERKNGCILTPPIFLLPLIPSLEWEWVVEDWMEWLAEKGYLN